MNDADRFEREVLTRARRALSPDPAARSRVHAATLGAIASGAGEDMCSPDDSAVPDDLAAQPWTELVTNAVGSATFKLTLVASLMAGSGVAGYWVGRGDVPQVPMSASPSASDAPVHAVAPPSETESALAPPSVSEAEELTQAEKSEAADEPGSEVRAAALPSVRAAPPSARSLDAELETLRRVERSLRKQNTRFALALLDELDHDVPKGSLMEERRAARLLARCQLGESGAREQAERFMQQHPGSVYLPRLRQTCDLAPGETGETAPSGKKVKP